MNSEEPDKYARMRVQLQRSQDAVKAFHDAASREVVEKVTVKPRKPVRVTGSAWLGRFKR